MEIAYVKFTFSTGTNYANNFYKVLPLHVIAMFATVRKLLLSCMLFPFFMKITSPHNIRANLISSVGTHTHSALSILS